MSFNLFDLMEANPRAGWRIDQVVTVCAHFEAKCTRPRGGGSHYKISKTGKKDILTIPYRRPIKPIYIKKPVAFLKE